MRGRAGCGKKRLTFTISVAADAEPLLGLLEGQTQDGLYVAQAWKDGALRVDVDSVVIFRSTGLATIIVLIPILNLRAL